jgi:hypothetical protein
MPMRPEVQTRLRKMQRHGAVARAQFTSQIVNRNPTARGSTDKIRLGQHDLTERGFNSQVL